MPRRPKFKEAPAFDEAVIDVFRKTSVDERERVALAFAAGKFNDHVSAATERGLLPIALITACLIDVEHPLLVDERGYLRAETLLGCGVLVMEAIAESRVVPTPCVQVEVVHRLEAEIGAEEG